MIPPIPHVKIYRGSKENLQRKNAQEVATAHRIAEHLFKLIANNPDEIQQYIFAVIAIDLGVTTDQVRSALSDGGYNGITLRIDEHDRRQVERYKSAPK
ncbi:putative lipoic acid-binding regulatory protein [Bradyrhizobium sp. USDA 4508]